MIDICPKCSCNNAPMVWLGKGKGWICEDCFEFEREVKKDANISDYHNHNMSNSCGACNNRK